MIVQVSTGSVAGDRVNDYPPRDEVLTEQKLYFGQVIDNQYVHSKFLAERYVLEAIRDGLKGKIMRVGNLAARDSDGEFQVNFVSNGFMGRLRAYLVIGAYPYSMMNYPVEMAPIDETAEAIVRLCSTPEKCCIFHPYNNHYVPLGDIILQMKRMGMNIKLAEDDEFAAMLSDAQNDPEKAAKLTTLLAYDNKDSSKKVEMIGTDNEYTTQALYRMGFSWSMTSRDYMNSFLNALDGLGFFETDGDEYLFPTIISSMSILLASFVDGIIVSALVGDDAFSAINLAEPVVLFMQALFFLFGIGGAISISIAKGQRDNRKANALFTLSFAASVLVSVIVTILGILLIDPITSVLCSNAALYDYVKHYALFNIFGSVFMIVVPYLVFIIRVDGMPKFSANILLVSNAVNLLMDLVYMGVFKMDTSGAALATVTGYVVGFIMELYYLIFFKKRTLKFVAVKGKDFGYLGELSTSGIASVVNTILLFVKAILLNRIVLGATGADGMAVFSVCNFTVTFISMFVSGGSDTMTPIVSLLYGERDYKGIDIVLRKTFLFVSAACAVIIAFILLFPNLLLAMFSVTSAERVAMGIPAVRIFSLSLIGMGVCYVTMNYLQATKQKAISVITTFLRGIVITVPLAYFLSYSFGISGTSWAFVFSEALTAAITFLVCFIVYRVKKDKYTGILLHERQTEHSVLFDASLRPNEEQAAGIADMIIAFCGENGVTGKSADYAGILAEEPATVEDTEEEFTNLKMIKTLADKVSYTRALGLNNMLIKIGRK